ncbi:aminotransferase, partial|uniref:DegT/DnrJ/EryC1/StrS family aminotransferase n=1 Tax=Escherichia coli TaxID=562 RepID=UPI0016A5D6BF
VKRKLEADGIQLGIHYKPNHLLSYYKSQYKLPLTEEIYLELTTLPLHPDLSGEDVNWICDKIKYVLQN